MQVQLQGSHQEPATPTNGNQQQPPPQLHRQIGYRTSTRLFASQATAGHICCRRPTVGWSHLCSKWSVVTRTNRLLVDTSSDKVLTAVSIPCASLQTTAASSLTTVVLEYAANRTPVAMCNRYKSARDWLHSFWNPEETLRCRR